MATSMMTDDEHDDDDALEVGGTAPQRMEEIRRTETHIAELQRMTMQQLLAAAKTEGLVDITGLKRQDLIFRILKERTKLNGLMFGE
ncbi:MAG: Rho termination factor N-terminal domain-containing protein, partial [Planctomycetaceae bacterium]